jgi:signal peptidase II
MFADLFAKPVLRHALPAALLAAVAIFALDQASKYLVVVGMNLREVGEIAVFPGLNFHMAWNTGVNFGILSGGGEATRYILAAVMTTIAIGLLIVARSRRHVISAIGLGVAAGGALGNVIDRLTWGAVADFLNVSCCGIRNPWSFNVADIAVFVGFAMLLLTPRSDVAPAETTPAA